MEDRQSAAVKQNDGYSASTFEDLEVYQLAREFRRRMHVVGRALPKLRNSLSLAKSAERPCR